MGGIVKSKKLKVKSKKLKVKSGKFFDHHHIGHLPGSIKDQNSQKYPMPDKKQPNINSHFENGQKYKRNIQGKQWNAPQNLYP